ncbi:PIN domain-containing protein [Kitasatospora griseola]|uniref:PIN domain-containing protein n=1 Tax=Kitasatospora griseola TaxID=2064 RepID=UPI00364DA264
MIILFDTNATNLIDLRSPRADVVRALRRSGQRVGVPGMVLEELVAHKTKEYMAQREGAASALNSLQRLMPWERAARFEEPRLELEECQAYWRKAYSELFEVVPTSGEAASKAMAREALGLPPAKRDAIPPEGARDAAIWFTLIEYLQHNPQDEIHFVTNNTKDFGDGVVLRFPMEQDLGECAGRLKRLEDFNAVVESFTEPVDASSAASAAGAHLGTEAVALDIGKLALVHGAIVGLSGIDEADETVQARGWVVPPSTALLKVGKVSGHRIGGQTWCTAEPTWVLFGAAALADGQVESVACVWEIKVLFPIDADGSDDELTLLHADDPTAPDMQNARTADAIKALRAKAIGESSTTRKRRTPSDTSELYPLLGATMASRLGSAVMGGTNSTAIAALLSQRYFAGLSENLKVSLLPPGTVGIGEAFARGILGTQDYRLSAADLFLGALKPRFDIATSLPRNADVPIVAAALQNWPHEKETEDEAEPGDGGQDGGKPAPDPGDGKG